MPNSFHDEIDSAALSAYGAGFSQRDAAALLGIGRSTLGRILKRYHFPAMHNAETAPDALDDQFTWQAELDIAAVEFVAILRRDPCSRCGKRNRVQIDHIEPKARGGTNSWENLSALCSSCNASKGIKPLLHYLLA